MNKKEKKEIIGELQKIFNYSEREYAQPRDSNKDGKVLLTICNNVGKIIRELNKGG